MADKDDIELDDFDLDEFNFDEFNMDSADAVDDRKPTTVIKDSAIEGFRGSLTDKNVVRRALEKSLPKEYESTFEALDAAGDTKDKIKDAMEPVGRQAKALARQNKKLVSRFLPRKMAEKLENWSEDYDTGGGYENIDTREAEVGASVADIFRLNQERDTEARSVDQESDTERFAIKEEAETKRHMSQVEVLEAIRSGISRQTDYQDQVLTKYQQKHLELTYRQLYTFQDILDLNKRQAESDNKSLSEIVKNTGLPETQKIKAFEEAKREVQADLRREAVEGVAGYAKGLGSKLIGNTVNTVSTRLQDAMGMAQDAQGMSEGGGGSAAQMIGNMMGSTVGKALMEKGIKSALQATGQDTDESIVRQMGARLTLMWQESPEKLLAWSGKDSERRGLSGMFENFIKSQVPNYSRVDSIATEMIADADEAATFTNRVARAITDVIPGYLSLQLHQLRLLVSGGEPVDKIEYNPETGGFGSADDKTKTVETRLFGDAKDRYQRTSKRASDGILGEDASLTDDQRQEFENFLYDHLSRGNSAELKGLPEAIKRSDYVQDSNKEALSKALMENSYDSSGEHYASADLNNATTETYKDINDLRSSIPYLEESIEKMVAAGYRNDLVKMGLIDEKGKIDHDVVAEYLGGRPISKRREDGTFKARVASGDRDVADGDRVVVPRVQNPRADMEERGRTSHGEALSEKPPTSETSSEIDEILRLIAEEVSEAGKVTVLRLSQLVEGQSTQIEKLDALILGLATPRAQTQMADSGQMDTLRQAIEDCCVKDEAAEQIELLRQILAIIPESAALGGAPTEGSKPILKSIADRVGKVAKGSSDILQSYFKGAFGVMGKVVETGGQLAQPLAQGAGSLLKSVGKRLTQGKAEAEALYVKGRASIAIHMSKLRAGEYIDGLTGETLWSLEDLKACKGDIQNKAGEVVLTVEELAKGLYDKHGKGIIIKAAGFLKSYYSMLWGGGKTLLGFIPPTVRAATGFAKGILMRQQDIYVKGEGTPRILANLLQRGHYRSQTTGKSIYTYDDIDGSIIDPDDRVVLSMEELEKVVGKDGKPIRSLTEKGVELVKAYYGALWGVTKGVGRFVGGLATGIKDRIAGKSEREGSGGAMDEEQSERTWTYWDEQLAILRRIDTRFTGGPPATEAGSAGPIGPMGTNATLASDSDGYTAPLGPQAPSGPATPRALVATLPPRIAGGPSEPEAGETAPVGPTGPTGTDALTSPAPDVYAAPQGLKDTVGDAGADQSATLRTLTSPPQGGDGTRGPGVPPDSLGPQTPSGLATPRALVSPPQGGYAADTPLVGPAGPMSPNASPVSDPDDYTAPQRFIGPAGDVDVGQPATPRALVSPPQGGYAAPQEPEASNETSDDKEPNLGAPSKAPSQGDGNLLGGVAGKLTGAVGSLKDTFSNYFSKSGENEEEHNRDRDQQTGILTNLTSATKERGDKLDDLQQSQLDSQAQMTKTLKGIEENTEKDELREGGWRERMAARKAKSSGEGEEEGEDDEPQLGEASKTLGYEKKSMADVLFGPLGGIVEKFGEYMGVFKGAIAGLTGWMAAKLFGGAATSAADAAGDLAGGGPRRGRGVMSRLWGGVKNVAKKGASLAVRAAPLVLPALATAGSAIATGAVAVGGAIATGAAAVGSVLASPIVLTAAAVAVVAYGGYKLYQYASRYTPKVLDRLRYAHYGLNIDSETNRTLVMSLEAYLDDNVSWNNGTPQITPDPKDDTLAKILGLTGENSEMDPQLSGMWFRDRFLPTWAAHRAILHNVYDDRVPLNEVDDLELHQKKAFLSSLSGAVSNAALNIMSGPYKEKPLEFNAEQARAMHMWAVDELEKAKAPGVKIPTRGATTVGKKPGIDDKASSASASTFPEYDDNGNITRTPGGNRNGIVGTPRSSGGASGSSWGGFTAKELKNSTASSKANTKYILSIKRHKQSSQSTISDAALIDKGTGHKVLEFKFLERPGPDTKEPNQRQRIPEGSYKLKWQTATGIAGVRPHLPVPWLYGNGVSDDRYIYIHNGNYPSQTDGCLLCGKDDAPNMVTSSVDTLERLKTELLAIGIENVTVEVSSAYAGGQKAPKTTEPAIAEAAKAGTAASVAGNGVEWSGEQTAMRAMAYQPGLPEDGRGESPIDRPGKASDREQEALSKIPEDWVTKEDIATVDASLAAQHPDKSSREIRTLKDIELTRLTNQRKNDWLSENGVSVGAAKAASVVADATSVGKPKVRSYGPVQETMTSAVYRPEAPALAEKPKRVMATGVDVESDVQETREAERLAQSQNDQREQSNLTQRVDKERRQQRESVSRIESVLGEQLSTQRRMSDNLDKLVLFAESKFQQDTNKSPAEYLVKRGYRPPQGRKEAFKPVVDLSS